MGLDWSPDGRQLVLAAGPLAALDLRPGTTRELVSGKDTLNGHESPDWQPRCTPTRTRDAIASPLGDDIFCGLSTATTGSGGRGRGPALRRQRP